MEQVFFVKAKLGLKRFWTLYLSKTLCIRTFICRRLQISECRFDLLSYEAISEKTLKAACTRLLLLVVFCASGNFFFQYWGMFLFSLPSGSNRTAHSFPIYFVRLCSMPVDLGLWTPMKREKKASVFVEKWKFNMFFVLKRMLIRRETRGIGKEWAVWLGSLGLLKQYNLTFLDVKFCVWMSNPFKNCCFLSQKKFTHRNLIPFKFFFGKLCWM